MYPYKLKSTETAKYLGVTIRKDLNWKSHIESISTKVSNTLKFIKRNTDHQSEIKRDSL